MVECAVPGGLVTDGTMYWDFYILASDAGFYLTIPLSNHFATARCQRLDFVCLQLHWELVFLPTSTGATTGIIHHLQL